MAIVMRVDGDLRVAGDVLVDGDMPKMPRARLVQDPNAVFAIPLTEMRVWDAMGTLLPAAGANDDLGLVGGTFGSAAPKLSTGDAKAATVTRYARFLFPIPAEYESAETLTLRISGGMETTVADDAATVDVQAYKSDRDGTIGSDLCTSAAQSINDLTFANNDFTITPTGLSAGDILDIRITVAVVDAATLTAVTAVIGAVEMLCDIKG
ncbi:MAG: hypothetical protein ACYC4U_11390 [Pirellulaceae bacterium]